MESGLMGFRAKRGVGDVWMSGVDTPTIMTTGAATVLEIRCSTNPVSKGVINQLHLWGNVLFNNVNDIVNRSDS